MGFSASCFSSALAVVLFMVDMAVLSGFVCDVIYVRT